MQPAENNDLKLGSLVRTGDDSSPLPLSHTAVTATITGSVAAVAVTQTFNNPFKDIIELSYLFPLPHEAAITDYEIQIASRTIHSEMKEIEAARKAYQDAVDAGHAASVLEQRRPNLFAVQIGNVEPGATITTTLRYQERVRYDDDSYTFVFPMGVTPKYHADLSQAPLLDSPIAQPEQKIGDVSLTLNVDAGVAAGDPTSPSHKIQINRQDERRFTVTLSSDTIPNKDFVLRYSVASDTAQPIMWVSADADVETLLLTLLPPRLSDNIKPDPREFIYVIDRSGSMSGAPLVQAKNALRACLRTMNETDTFTIQAFDDRIEWFANSAQTVTQEVVNKADSWLDQVDARGGTEIVPAISAALSLPADARRQRYVVFLTDGAVSAEEQVKNDIKKLRGNTRLFTFGIGSSVNRALLAKMAEFGRGTAEFLQINEDIETAITRFQDRVSYPVLQDLALSWQNAETWDVYPPTLPDLYICQALELVARLKRKDNKTDATLTVSGKRQGQTVTLTASVPAATETSPALQRIWARARVDALMEQPGSDATRQQIISLAIDHRLITPYTAFVAVDSEVVAKSGDAPRKVAVAVPLPENVDFLVGSAMPPAPMGMPAPVAAAPKARGGGGLLKRISQLLPSDPRYAPPPPKPAPSSDPFAGMDPLNWMESTAKKQEPKEPSEETPIESLDISVRLLNSLKNTGVTTVEEVMDMLDRGTDAMLAIRNFGEKALNELEETLREKGYMPKESPRTIPSEPISERIKWLARTQNLTGSWSDGNEEGELTAAALLAFVRAGHTTRVGIYRAQVRKAADWLKAANLTGFAAFARWRALHELDVAQGTDTYAGSLKAGTPTNDPEQSAVGDSALMTPAQVTSLDELRTVSILAGEATPADSVVQDKTIPLLLIQTWMAVGKPTAGI